MSTEENTTTTEQQQQVEEHTENNASPDKNKSPRPHRKVSYRARTASNANNTPNNNNTTQLNSEERQKSVHALTDTMFQDVSLLIKGEMQLGFNDLKLLENMNQAVAKKYENMTGRAQQVKEHVSKMKQSYDAFKPYFEQITQIEGSVDELANIVKYLDQYSKNLEIQLKPYL